MDLEEARGESGQVVEGAGGGGGRVVPSSRDGGGQMGGLLLCWRSGVVFLMQICCSSIVN
jgi:hypothetical protein